MSSKMFQLLPTDVLHFKAGMAELVGPAAIEVAKYSAEPIKRQFNYLCCFSTNIRKLENAARKLDDAKVEVEGQVDAARRNAKVIVPRVGIWLDDVDKIQANMSAIDPEVLNVKNRCFFAIKSRFSLSRKATKMVTAMKELLDNGQFGQISYPPLPAAMAPSIPLGQTYELQSRKYFEEYIMAILREKKASMMGISGMGGVGKTTMAKKIMRRARGEGLFDEIVMVVVSQPVDMLRIQRELAELLGLSLDVESLPARAHLLRARLMNAKSILIILDDLWKNLNLEDLGIPDQREMKECMILLTSRDMDVFSAMNVEKNFQMKTLEDEEAWSLFKEKVGVCANDQSLFSIAHEIVQECRGLPIALVTVGMALKDKTSKFIWEDAVQELKSCNPRDIPDFLAQVYNPLKLSYDLLESEHARSVLLMCCLFPEDRNIPISDLCLYAWGLDMFEGIRSFQAARNKVQTLVEMLRSRSLLLDGFNGRYVKIHDVVRDVGIFIAAKEGSIDANLSWKREESICTWISLFDADKTTLPGVSKFPNLRLLLIEGPQPTTELPPCDNFFESARNLHVLSIRRYMFESLPHTIQLQKNLRTLILYNCSSLEDISIVCELVSLEILYCYDCHSINELPGGIGRLNQLKLLDISSCSRLKTIPAGVISRLVRLEELTLFSSFNKWESGGSEGKNARLCELNSLSSLTTLRIQIKDASLAAEQFHLPPNLVDFHVEIGNSEYVGRSRRWMQVELKRDVIIGDWILQLLRTTESLALQGEFSNKLVPFLPEFQSLEWLAICENVKMRRLIDGGSSAVFPLLEYLALEGIDDLEEIHKSPISSNSFSKLQELSLEYLPKLQHLGTDYLLRLKRLSILSCPMLEQVVLWNEEENLQSGRDDRSRTTFPKLEHLRLDDLPRLTSFCRGTQCIEFPLLIAIEIKKCPNMKSLVSSTDSDRNKCSGSMKHDKDGDSLHLFCRSKVSFGRLESLIIDGISNEISQLWCGQILMDFFSGLGDLTISNCDNITSLFSFTIAKNLVNLKSINIRSCSMLEQVMLWNEEKNGQSSHIHHRITLPKIKTLVVDDLPKLTSLCKEIQSIEFPLLTDMTIMKCPNIKGFGAINHDAGDSLHLFCNSEATFGRLEHLVIGGYDIISSLWCDKIPIHFFNRLVHLRVLSCVNMKSLFSPSISENLINLRRLFIKNCPEMVKLIEDEEVERSPLIKLEDLVLNNLPKLKAFCDWRCALKLPSLKEVLILECPGMERFSFGSLTTPNLDYIWKNMEPIHSYTKDLNDALLFGDRSVD